MSGFNNRKDVYGSSCVNIPHIKQMNPNQDESCKCGRYGQNVDHSECNKHSINTRPCNPFNQNMAYNIQNNDNMNQFHDNPQLHNRTIQNNFDKSCLLTDFDYDHSINSYICSRSYQYTTAFHPAMYPTTLDIHDNMTWRGAAFNCRF